ncbi:hypothetical protein DPMN_154254 [Dreissena polymorpha]|uniref:Uncharacterized protein n=1 Tax=Dreissena polymorpha TaxID=45954 RepID=A0A9D4J5J3_DREPO|nr:hypothetical protein DPMN_154254 [Dreissena polymorpha]
MKNNTAHYAYLAYLASFLRYLKPQSLIRTNGYGSPKTITTVTTRQQHEQTRQQHTISTALTRTFPDILGNATDQNGRDTGIAPDKHEPTRHFHKPTLTYTTKTREITAAI